MILSQYRVVPSAWRSDAIAQLSDSKLICFPFVGPVRPSLGTRLQILGTRPPRAFFGLPSDVRQMHGILKLFGANAAIDRLIVLNSPVADPFRKFHWEPSP